MKRFDRHRMSGSYFQKGTPWWSLRIARPMHSLIENKGTKFPCKLPRIPMSSSLFTLLRALRFHLVSSETFIRCISDGTHGCSLLGVATWTSMWILETDLLQMKRKRLKKKKEKNRKSKSRPQAGTNSSSFPSSKRHSQHLYPLSPSFPDSILSHVTKVK